MTCKRDLEEATAVLSAWGMTGVVDAEVLISYVMGRTTCIQMIAQGRYSSVHRLHGQSDAIRVMLQGCGGKNRWQFACDH